MTKKDLERRNDFLLLQLKIISELVNDDARYEGDKIHEIIGNIMAITDPENIKDNIHFIESFDKQYNFYREELDLNGYK